MVPRNCLVRFASLLCVITFVFACADESPETTDVRQADIKEAEKNKKLGELAAELQSGSLYGPSGGFLGFLCTETSGNPIGSTVADVVNFFEGGLDDSDKGGDELCRETSAMARPTLECTDYCSARGSYDWRDSVLQAISYASYNTYLPPSVYASIINHFAGTSAINSAQVGLLQCANLVGWAASEYYHASKACERGSQCVTCDETSSSLRSACLIGQTALWCAEALGYQAPPGVSALSASCTLGRMCNKGITLEGCRRSCAESIEMAKPVVTTTGDWNPDAVTCCKCRRYEKYSSWGSHYTCNTSPGFQSNPTFPGWWVGVVQRGECKDRTTDYLLAASQLCRNNSGVDHGDTWYEYSSCGSVPTEYCQRGATEEPGSIDTTGDSSSTGDTDSSSPPPEELEPVTEEVVAPM